MKVLVDTCIWSLALRRSVSAPSLHLEELKELIREARVQLVGPVRQEILSGVKSERQFKKLKESLAAFPDLPLNTRDFEQAAHYFNLARRKGIQGSNTDFLLCAVAAARNLAIYTLDQDFVLFQSVFSLRFHEPRINR